MYWMGYTSAPPGELLSVSGYAVCRCITVALIVAAVAGSTSGWTSEVEESSVRRRSTWITSCQ